MYRKQFVLIYLLYAVLKSHGRRLVFSARFSLFDWWYLIVFTFHQIPENHREPNERKDHHFCQQNRIQHKCSSLLQWYEYYPQVEKNERTKRIQWQLGACV